MNIANGLYFPGTKPDLKRLFPILCLLDKVDYYQIVEQEGSGRKQGYLEGKVVLPLGDDRDRFMAMIRDVKAHAADFYGGYLSSLSDNALIDRDESSVWQLVANLHGEEDKSGHDQVVVEKLWQARMVLHLAEIFSEEQQDLANDLLALEHKEKETFNALKGVVDDSDDEDKVFQANGLSMSGGHNSSNIRNLLKAWGTLFVLDNSERPMLVTDSEDAAMMLFDAWEELHADRPGLLAEIALPVVGSIEDLEAAREQMAEGRMAIGEALQDILTGENDAGTASLKSATGLWQKKIGLDIDRQCLAEIYLFPGHSLKSAWGRISRMAVEKDSDKNQSSLVILLKQVS